MAEFRLMLQIVLVFQNTWIFDYDSVPFFRICAHGLVLVYVHRNIIRNM